MTCWDLFAHVLGATTQTLLAGWAHLLSKLEPSEPDIYRLGQLCVFVRHSLKLILDFSQAQSVMGHCKRT